MSVSCYMCQVIYNVSMTTITHTQTRYKMTSRVLLHYQHTNDYCRLLTLTYVSMQDGALRRFESALQSIAESPMEKTEEEM